jgi:hypothetical protein
MYMNFRIIFLLSVCLSLTFHAFSEEIRRLPRQQNGAGTDCALRQQPLGLSGNRVGKLQQESRPLAVLRTADAFFEIEKRLATDRNKQETKYIFADKLPIKVRKVNLAFFAVKKRNLLITPNSIDTVLLSIMPVEMDC